MLQHINKQFIIHYPYIVFHLSIMNHGTIVLVSVWCFHYKTYALSYNIFKNTTLPIARTKHTLTKKKTKKKWWATNDRRKPYWCCVKPKSKNQSPLWCINIGTVCKHYAKKFTFLILFLVSCVCFFVRSFVFGFFLVA